jgi:hypothetical protein
MKNFDPALCGIALGQTLQLNTVSRPILNIIRKYFRVLIWGQEVIRSPQQKVQV